MVLFFSFFKVEDGGEEDVAAELVGAGLGGGVGGDGLGDAGVLVEEVN